MINNDLWIVTTKSRPLENCPVDFDGSEFYFVECLVPAKTAEEAVSPMKAVLLEKKMDLAEVLDCSLYVPEEWDGKIQTSAIKKAAQKAKEANQLEFSVFISSDAMDFDDEEED